MDYKQSGSDSDFLSITINAPAKNEPINVYSDSLSVQKNKISVATLLVI